MIHVDVPENEEDDDKTQDGGKSNKLAHRAQQRHQPNNDCRPDKYPLLKFLSLYHHLPDMTAGAPEAVFRSHHGVGARMQAIDILTYTHIMSSRPRSA